jgi:hypothetical protein
MSIGYWIEIDDDFQLACDHFTKANEIFAAGGFGGQSLDSYRSSMALMHAMQLGHTSLESGLTRILKIIDEELPVGDNWHVDLIKRVSRSTNSRPAILTEDAARDADETRRFRNIATKNYNNFKPEESLKSVQAAGRLASCLIESLNAFKAIIDPPTPENNL